MAKKLSLKQERFVEEYLVDLNATQAYIRAGYAKKFAGPNVGKLMALPEIQKAIQKGKAKLSKRTEISQDRVLEELVNVAFSNLGDYMDWNSHEATMIAKDKLSREQMAAVAEINATLNDKGSTIKFKLHDKIRSLKILADHLGMFVQKHEIDFKHGLADRISERLQRAKDASSD